MEGARVRPSKVTDEALLAAVPAATNLRQLLLSLGVAAYGGNYEVVRERLQRLGVEEPRFARQPRRRAFAPPSLEELARVARVADSYAQAARLLRMHDGPAAHRRVKRMIEAAGLDVTHFLGKGSGRGFRAGGRAPLPLESVLVTGRRVHTANLRERLLAEGVLARECAGCLRSEWQGQPIPLELDHVNGDRADNRLENLRVLCPNCHAQTSTYRGRNIGALTVSEDAPAGQQRQAATAAALRRMQDLLAPAPAYGGGTPP